MFTVLFSDDEDIKEGILRNVCGESNIINSKNYTKIKENYERAKWHLENDIKYDFFKFRKQVRKFTHFKIQENEIIESECRVEDKVTIVMDPSIGKDLIIKLEECTVKDAKKILFDKIGLSVSKQEICKNEEVLNNSRILKNETVVLRQKRRTNSKKGI